MKKKVFNELEMTVILLEEEDIVRTSGDVIIPDEGDIDFGN